MERSNLTFLKQAARGARPERGEPIAPHPTTRGQFQRTHPRGRAWPGGGARSLLASLRPEAPRAPFAFWSAGHARRTARGGRPACRGGTGGGAVLVASQPHRSPDASARLVRTRFDPLGSPDASAHLVHTRPIRSPARAPCQPLSGASVRRLRVVHDACGEIRLHPTQRRVCGSNAPTRDGVRGRGAEHAIC